MKPERRTSEKTVGEKTGEAARQQLGEKRMGMRIRCSNINDTEERESWGGGVEMGGPGRSDAEAPPPRSSRGEKAEGRGEAEEQGADWQKTVALSWGARGKIASRGALRPPRGPPNAGGGMG